MKFLQLIQIIVSCLLVASILIQNRGASISGIFGGSDSVYSVKRGAEKVIFKATIVLSIIFFSLALANIFA